MARKVHEAADPKDRTRGALKRRLEGKDRPHFAAAVELAAAKDWVALGDGGGLNPGLAQPVVA